jgi:hypothetical protein
MPRLFVFLFILLVASPAAAGVDHASTQVAAAETESATAHGEQSGGGSSEQRKSSEPSPSSGMTICQAIESAAAENGLPISFFTRLIWQESRFSTTAISRAGAQGIAQFMPRTAAWRGVANPFNPIEALPESAEFLRELRNQFGNLGLAAAAYNAGPGRVQRWLAGRSRLPGETRAYVRIITGRSADEWRAVGAAVAEAKMPPGVPCRDFTTLFAAVTPRAKPTSTKAAQPWGLQLIGHWSEAFALASYANLQKKYRPILGDYEPLVLRTKLGGRGASWVRIRVGADTRQDADRLCSRLRAVGGACLVMKN